MSSSETSVGDICSALPCCHVASMASRKWKRSTEPSEQNHLVSIPSVRVYQRNLKTSNSTIPTKPSKKWRKGHSSLSETSSSVVTERPNSSLEERTLTFVDVPNNNTERNISSADDPPVDTTDSIDRDSADDTSDILRVGSELPSSNARNQNPNQSNTTVFSMKNEEGHHSKNWASNHHIYPVTTNKMKWKREPMGERPALPKVHSNESNSTFVSSSMNHPQAQSLNLQQHPSIHSKQASKPTAPLDLGPAGSSRNTLLLNNHSTSMSRKWSKGDDQQPVINHSVTIQNPKSTSTIHRDKNKMSYQRPLVKRIRLMENQQPTNDTDYEGSEHGRLEDSDTAVEKLSTSKGMTDFAYRETGRVKSGMNNTATSITSSSTTRRRRNMGLVRVKPVQDQTPICPSFLEGKVCENELCTFRHDVSTEAAMPLCSFFQKNGQCLKMDTCPFRHVKVSNSAPICLSFQRLGYCENPQCFMKHIRPTRTN